VSGQGFVEGKIFAAGAGDVVEIAPPSSLPGNISNPG